VINTTFGEQVIKLAAGDAVIYPASSLHRVNPIIKGERMFDVCWIQRLIHDPAQRELLFGLNSDRHTLMENLPGAQETKQTDQPYVNLVRKERVA